jgi:hypothetical protein
MEEYDTNHDGRLDARELERCPALKNSLTRFDKDGDGSLSTEEIRTRLALYRNKAVGLTAVSCKVFLDRKPLPDAQVTFVPETFLGRDFRPASGTTSATGKAILALAGQKTPGLPYGLYRIEVSKKDAGGRELLPAKYNAQTTLGEEVAPDLGSYGVTLRLSSR